MADLPLPEPVSAVLRRPLAKRLLRAALWGSVAVYFAFAALVLLLRYAILPQIEHYRGDLEQALSRGLGLPVAIARIDAGWQGLRPRLGLHGVQIHDKSGRPALSFDNVDAVLGWRSVLYLEPRLHRLEVVAPALSLRRDTQGQFFVAGLPVDTASTEPGFGDWLSRQHHVIVRDATVTWTDELRGAPPLALNHLNFQLDNDGRDHQFGLTAVPPEAFAAPLDVRGELRGRPGDPLADWRGRVFGDFPRADLAAWHPWVDYPLELPRGHGSLRFWVEFAGLMPTALTADVALADVQVRLAPSLPLLDLLRLEGRLEGRRGDDTVELGAEKLMLTTREGLTVATDDARLRWSPLAGRFATRGLDLGALARLTGYLPLPEGLRSALQAYGVKGRLDDVEVTWHGAERPFERYRAKGRFRDLALAADGDRPGFSGLSGSIDGDERGGRLNLSARDGSLDLPAVFPEPHLVLVQLDADVSWRRNGRDLEMDIARAKFHNRDAEGTASGHYHWPGHGAGEIDLEARLSRGEGNAVWRYLPLAVNAEARNWLRTSLLAGRAENVGLTLRGPLDRFPFVDGSGVFRIQGDFHGGVLKYGNNWPQIDDVTGQLRFEGARMTITASQGRIFGVALGPVKAEIPDLDSKDEKLELEGKASGATADFLRFIEASPVGDQIDHFTEEMRAVGNGELTLRFTMPLEHVADTQVFGSYRADGNRLLVEPGLPMLDDVRGRIEFTGDSLSARDVQARLLGGPMRLDVKTEAGAVAVNFDGELSAAQLRQQLPNPAFDHLSGTTRWSGTVRAKGKNASVRIVSDLRGVASSLPVPFNKSASDAMPFQFERRTPDPALLPKRTRTSEAAARDQIDVSFGKVLKAQILRRREGSVMRAERGLVSLGDPALRMPDRGIALGIALPRIDVDFWRSVAAGRPGNGAPATAAPANTVTTPASTTAVANGKPASAADKSAEKAGDKEGRLAALGLGQIDIRTPELVVAGRLLRDVRLTASRRPASWSGDVKTAEIAGRFDWIDSDPGRLVGRISQFALPPVIRPAADGAADSLAEGSLPALDLTFERFVYEGKEFGELHIVAENRDGSWNAKIAVQNADASLTGEGRWHPRPDAPDTRVDFKLDARNMEKTFARVGYPSAVRRGAAVVEGSLSWNGPPYAVDYPSLAGTLKVEAKDGQFAKMEPGVGRLLGIISLQSLPRRITLDFTDIFSQGFAFDSIRAQATVNRGLLDTQDLEILGPAAKVQMAGTVDLARETQDLKVRVQPSLSETPKTAVLLAHPAVGVVVWGLDKLFGSPLDRAFAYDYAISGSWADPKVEKIAAPAKADAK